MNKVSLRKRFTSLALAAVMMLGMVPSSAFPALAAGSDNDPSANAINGIGDVVADAGPDGVDFQLDLQRMDVEGKLYSENTLPKSMGGAHDRGLALYYQRYAPAVKLGSGGYFILPYKGSISLFIYQYPVYLLWGGELLNFFPH